LPPVRFQRKDRRDKKRARQLLKLQTKPTTDFSPETKRLLTEAKANNFGKPVKPIAAKKKTQKQELQEAKERLMDTTPGKREQRLIDGYIRRAAELEKRGNPTEAALYHQQAERVRRNCIAIREVFAENIAKHEKEISGNLSKPLNVIRAERKAKEAARVEKMREIMKKKQETMKRNK
jgi:hypothetical protein